MPIAKCEALLSVKGDKHDFCVGSTARQKKNARSAQLAVWCLQRQRIESGCSWHDAGAAVQGGVLGAERGGEAQAGELADVGQLRARRRTDAQPPAGRARCLPGQR